MERQYKDSGIEWIGKIPEEWEVCSLKSMAVIERGGSPRPIENYLSEEGYNWIKIGDTIKGNKFISSVRQKIKKEGLSKTRMVHSGDLILTNSMSFGEPYILQVDGCIHDGWVAISKLTNIDKEFLYYLLLSPLCQYQFQLQVAGGVVQNLNVDKIAATFILCPPLTEQQRIVGYLEKKCGEIDSLIGLQEQMIEKLKAYKQSVITEAVTKGLDPNAKLVPSGIDWIGEIPEGVKLVKLSMVTSKIGSGSTPRGGSSIYVKEGIKFLRSQNIYCEGLDLSDVAYITEEIDEEMSGTRVQIGDVLLNITGGSIGRCYYVDKTLGRANVNQHVSIIRPTIIESKYLKYYLQSECGQLQIALFQTGGNREGLSAAALNQFTIIYPLNDDQQAIASYLDEKCSEIDRLIAIKQQKIEKLKDYKKSVIYEAVTGKTEINDKS